MLNAQLIKRSSVNKTQDTPQAGGISQQLFNKLGAHNL